MTTNTALIKVPRRAAWPTLTLTVLALLAVVGVLLLTGSRAGAVARFELRASPSAISLTAGDSAAVVHHRVGAAQPRHDRHAVHHRAAARRAAGARPLDRAGIDTPSRR